MHYKYDNLRGKKLPIPAAQIIRYGVTDLKKYTTNKTLNIIHIVRRVTAYPNCGVQLVLVYY